MTINGNNIKIAIQKDGKLAEGSVEILRQAGFAFETGKGRLLAVCENFPLDILFVRDDDIPEYVRDGVCDLGIVGQDVLKKGAFQLSTICELGFGKCRLAIAAPKESGIVNLRALQGKTIATSFPTILAEYLKDNAISARVITLSGSVEIAPALGVADAICDLVSTGSTLKTHELVEIATIFTSEAALVQEAAHLKTRRKSELIENFTRRIRAVLTAQKTKYILLNAPKDKVTEIAQAIPGVKSPTVLPLYNPEWVAIHSVVREDVFWETVDKLKTLGAQGILVLPIEKMIL
ncbi:MAG: ATP phosphoribosyltransferase [Candidatus Jacksonbacteria bacterium]|nr:ATP phosphoribosyltransferase [Candidatus Jacksonbacteria bacterium]